MSNLRIGIGEWKMRDGQKVSIISKNPFYAEFPWIGSWSGLDGVREWTDDGTYCAIGTISSRDIIAPWTSPIAKGNNPDKLTDEEVGVANGWRLLDEDEIVGVWCGYERLGHVDCWSCGQWQPGNRGICNEATYRTRLSREELAALDKPKKRLIRVDELPPVCHVKRAGEPWHEIVSKRDPDNQRIALSGNDWVSTMTALAYHWQWSSDLKTWNSFEVEEKP